ncbi:MAG TPA: IPT/TIG domain-containing protein [Myxococcota bacterium]|nr:IPT/TIG domain-containing protein [Myxococcota bacterium]HOH76461.1 IPT/TIG domain-containing protein [Myxococcota bacterium]
MGLRNTLFRLVPAAVLMAVGLVSCAGDDGWPDSGPDSTPGFDVPGEFVSDLDQPDLIDSDQFPAELPGQDGSVPDSIAADSDAPDSGPTYPLAVDSMDPRQGDPATSTMVTLTGSGFSAVVDVWFGQARSPSVFAISDGILNCVAPPARSGSVQVIVEDSFGRRASAPGEFVYSGVLAVDAVSPASGPSVGGSPVVVRGAGFSNLRELYFGDRPAIAFSVASDDEVLAVTPPGRVGPSSVRAVGEEGDVRADGIWAFDPVDVGPTMPDVAILSVSPAIGPVSGGQKIVIAGSGFFEGLDVYVGPLPCTDVHYISDELIEAVTPPGTPGAADVTLSFRYMSVVSRGAYFFRGFDGGTAGIFAVEPPDASWAGGSLVSVRGFGLSGIDTVWFGSNAGTIHRRVSDFEIIVRTPRVSAAGRVFVMGLGKTGAMLPDGFRFYDPYLYGGGSRGRRISGDVQVTVYDGSTGARLSGAYVIIGADLHTRLQGRTDDRGQITLSSEELAGAVDVSATATTYTAFTYAGVRGRDVTFALYATPPPETPTEPQPQEPSPTCTVSGRVRDFGKYFIKPQWLDGTAWVECFTSTSSMYSSMSTLPESNRPREDGRFSIPARSGEFAVICRLMALETGMQQAYPLRMGVSRHVRCTDGSVPDVELSLDIITESVARFGIVDAPAHHLGTWEPRFSGGWHLGSDGYLPLPYRGSFDGGTVTFERQPDKLDGEGISDLAGTGYDLYATISSKDNTGMPYSVVQVTGLMPSSDGILLIGSPEDLRRVDTSIGRSFTTFERFSDGSALAVDDSGRTWVFDGSGFTAGRHVFSFKVNDIAGESPDDFTAVGTRGRIVHVSEGVAEVVQTQFVWDFSSIDGPPGGPFSIVAGNYLLRLENGIVTIENVPAGAVMSTVRRFEDGTIFAAGPDGLIVTGTSQSPLAAVRPVAEDLYAVAGESPLRVWMAGENGRVILIRDGDVTVFKTPGSEALRGILELGECNVLFFGDSGALYQYDCFRFNDISDRTSMPYAISRGVVLDAAAGLVAMVSPPVNMLPGFAGFPEVSMPVDGMAWNGRDIEWASGRDWGATHCQGLISGVVGSAAWQFVADGSLSSIQLPDFSRAIGYAPLGPGPKRMNLTCSRTPRFDIGNFDYRALSTTIRETYSVDMASFY